MSSIRLRNEFAEVSLRVIETGNGERLEIQSKRGTRIQLDPVELEALTWQTTATFTKMLEGSIGPTDLDGAPSQPTNGARSDHG